MDCLNDKHDSDSSLDLPEDQEEIQKKPEDQESIQKN